jgi:hypothetical protein
LLIIHSNIPLFGIFTYSIYLELLSSINDNDNYLSFNHAENCYNASDWQSTVVTYS